MQWMISMNCFRFVYVCVCEYCLEVKCSVDETHYLTSRGEFL